MPLDLPDRGSSEALAGWLEGPRSRLLRRAQIGLRQRVLEVGCGHGLVSAELARRAPGLVVALDHREEAARSGSAAGACGVAGRAEALPFGRWAFDLILCQNVLMWCADLEAAVRDLVRVLVPGGVLVALEPDYGGMLEYPPAVALRDVWEAALRRAGADPQVGRKLPEALEAAGLRVQVELLAQPRPVGTEALALLEDLALEEDERARVAEAARALGDSGGTWGALVHVPYVLVTGTG